MGWLVIGVATGGVGLVVIGVAVAASSYAGGKAGEWGGEQIVRKLNNLIKP